MPRGANVQKGFVRLDSPYSSACVKIEHFPIQSGSGYACEQDAEIWSRFNSLPHARVYAECMYMGSRPNMVFSFTYMSDNILNISNHLGTLYSF